MRLAPEQVRFFIEAELSGQKPDGRSVPEGDIPGPQLLIGGTIQLHEFWRIISFANTT
jgi:hypothetical protein